VRVLSVNNKGRYELSTKQVEQPVIEPTPTRERRKPAERIPEVINLGPEEIEDRKAASLHANFEERLIYFMRDSQERLLDLKRNMEAKRGMKRR